MNSNSNRRRLAMAAALLCGAGALAGCKSKAPDELPPNPYAGPPPGSQNGYGQGGAGSGYGGGLAGGVGSQEHFSKAVNGRTTIYFDTDRFNIDSADAAALTAQGQYLMANPSVRVTIEGHTDERGTRDYNLALGERRANAAKNFLVSIGVPAARITTVSYGKERPAALGSDQEAWAENRRAVTVVVG